MASRGPRALAGPGTVVGPGRRGRAGVPLEPGPPETLTARPRE
ncbi:hypothetical protein [Dactylosporangium vinaceum]|uniref:Uncharacterized protein n=1 Tax=Dactylosporangium vinaceum TaxID=53362 RepID=A0ABV5MCK3_9ACTN|nr:hypothetical protein [Dactylosporangium vinaceum]